MSLKELSELRGVSGQEEAVRNYIIDEIKDFSDIYWTDSIGNLYVRPEKENEASIGLFAHMDEVGMMVTGIDKHLLHFDTVGGINQELLPGTKVLVGRSEIPGVIGCPPIHLQEKEEREIKVPMKDLRIDIGEQGPNVRIGDMVTFDTPYRERRGIAIGKAFDDRIGCHCLINAIKNGKGAGCVFVFTTQEEAGLRGARVAADNVDLDWAIACEGTFALDQPGMPEQDRMPKMGGGPVITIADRSVISDRKLIDIIVSAADEERLTYQFKRPFAGGTDAGMVHLSKRGVPSCVISNPCRYIHSPCALASINDIEKTSKLIGATIKRIKEVK